MNEFAPSHLTVNLSAYAHNLTFIRQRIPTTTRIMVILKADAYGLGAAPLAARALEEGISDFGVATVAEGIALRETVGDATILVLTQPPEETLSAALEHDLHLLISDVSIGERLGELAHKTKTLATIH
ncbi:MAG: alanine racemase [Candidatus Hydrogenedentes bacterium]|nr:alanine racemase [Candidatus Hydrogenedentota bacterium]